ncbi:hypothetical protein KY389_10005 [Paracoccus bogoriensis]|uniref:hypothetical protein n=1 Tax=Paracoccus bogoriensis TaxID=242065 RepID=UPI001CA4B5EA|nr:hypothetical protein [Paracoccus bogoriensis]MBW7057022.1 hypothetical protein [Paracoccus bogoriensis]
MTAAAQRITEIKAAILSGDVRAAQKGLDLLEKALAGGVDDGQRRILEPALRELRALAEASLKGARQAAEDLRDIIVSAQSLQTYDDAGCRRSATTLAPMPRRF